MSKHNLVNRIDYIEFPAPSIALLAQTKVFYQTALGWEYQDWGASYADTQSSGVGSGINADISHRPRYPLAVIHADDLEETRTRVVASEGKITRDIFAFPGGRRFHFMDPAGNELAVWSDK